jgi:hypothetical protein
LQKGAVNDSSSPNNIGTLSDDEIIALGANRQLITDAPGVELRFHATTLYNSIYRFDDDMLVNAHVYGAPAAHSPVLHLRRLPGGRLVDHYQASFERVWEQASADSVPGALAQGERR